MRTYPSTSRPSTTLAALIAAFCLLGTVSAQVVVTNVSTVPVSATINQSSFSDASSVQARDGTGDLRAVTQTFTWNSSEQLDGIGLRLATAQNTLNPYTTDRTWVLDIQQISGNGRTSAASIESTVAHLTFTLPASAVSPNSYLYFDLTTNFSLTSGETYGFILYPAAANSTPERLFFSRSADATSYTGGIASQVPGISGPGPYGGTYGGAGYNTGFFITTVPEPSSVAMVGVSLGVFAVFGRRRFRKN